VVFFAPVMFQLNKKREKKQSELAFESNFCFCTLVFRLVNNGLVVFFIPRPLNPAHPTTTAEKEQCILVFFSIPRKAARSNLALSPDSDTQFSAVLNANVRSLFLSLPDTTKDQIFKPSPFLLRRIEALSYDRGYCQ
jgi:hypothetical protein